MVSRSLSILRAILASLALLLLAPQLGTAKPGKAPSVYPVGVNPSAPIAVGNVAYFYGYRPQGRALFRTDGTEPGTTIVGPVPRAVDQFRSVLKLTDDGRLIAWQAASETVNAAGKTVRQPSAGWLVQPGGTPLFRPLSASELTPLRAAWSWPTSPKGTTIVATRPSGDHFVRVDATGALAVLSPSGELSELGITTPVRPPLQRLGAGDPYWFAASDPEHGEELWRSDGTVAGTRLAADLAPGSASSAPWSITASGDRVIVQATPEGREPFVSRPDALFWVGPVGEVRRLVNEPKGVTRMSGDRLLSNEFGVDGGPPSVRIWDVRSGEQIGGFQGSAEPLGDVLEVGNRWTWLDLGNGIRGVDLPGGKAEEISDAPGFPIKSSGPNFAVAIGKHLLFDWHHPSDLGFELWSSDGTRDGTRPITVPGRFSSATPKLAVDPVQVRRANRRWRITVTGTVPVPPVLGPGTWCAGQIKVRGRKVTGRTYRAFGRAASVRRTASGRCAFRATFTQPERGRKFVGRMLSVHYSGAGPVSGAVVTGILAEAPSAG